MSPTRTHGTDKGFFQKLRKNPLFFLLGFKTERGCGGPTNNRNANGIFVRFQWKKLLGVRSQNKVKKRRGRRNPLQNNTPEKDKISGTLVWLLRCAAAPGLKPLRLPRAQIKVHVHPKNTFPGGIGNRRIMFVYNFWVASHPSSEYNLAEISESETSKWSRLVGHVETSQKDLKIVSLNPQNNSIGSTTTISLHSFFLSFSFHVSKWCIVCVHTRTHKRAHKKSLSQVHTHSHSISCTKTYPPTHAHTHTHTHRLMDYHWHCSSAVGHVHGFHCVSCSVFCCSCSAVGHVHGFLCFVSVALCCSAVGHVHGFHFVSCSVFCCSCTMLHRCWSCSWVPLCKLQCVLLHLHCVAALSFMFIDSIL